MERMRTSCDAEKKKKFITDGSDSGNKKCRRVRSGVLKNMRLVVILSMESGGRFYVSEIAKDEHNMQHARKDEKCIQNFIRKTGSE
jgi:uncharacterized protein (UPF0128 family)